MIELINLLLWTEQLVLPFYVILPLICPQILIEKDRCSKIIANDNK